MVRVVSAHHFLSQSIQTCDVPYAATTAPPDRLLLALSHQVEVRDLSSDGEVKFTFPTVDQSHFLAYCAADIKRYRYLACFNRNYSIPTVKVKKPRKTKVDSLNNSLFSQEIFDYFAHSKTFNREKDKIPKKLLSRIPKQPENLCLMDEKVAKDIVKLIKHDVITSETPIFECNSGFGLITNELLAAGASSIRIYEMDPAFKEYAQNLETENPGKVTFFSFNFLQLWKLTFQDLMDHGNRLKVLMDGVKVKRWEEDSNMSFIGVLTKSTFIRHIVFSIIFQSGVITYGRPELYLLLTPNVFLQMREDRDCGQYQSAVFTTLYSLFFDLHLYGTVNRLSFLPWQNETAKMKKMCSAYNLDENQLYFIKLSPKRDLFKVTPPHLIKPLWFFVKRHLHHRNNRVIPMMEQWVPGCGPRLINKGYNVFTQFTDLTSQQILELFLDFTQWPEFPLCPFIPAMDSTTVKMESPSDFDIDTEESKPEDEQSNLGED